MLRNSILAAALCAALPAQALTLTWDRTHENAYLTGNIEAGDEWRIINAVSASSAVPHYVWITSKGGDLGAAKQLALFVKAHGFAVIAREVCSSACVAIWLSGSTRYVAPGTRIGVHSASAWSQSTGKWDHVDPAATAAVARLYRKLGVSERLVGIMEATPISTMYYFDTQDLKELGARVIE
jgi:hypothetical protein